MTSRFALPYYAPDLPSTLPTEAEIENASDLREYCFKGRRVVAVSEHYIVKYGPDVNLLEGDNMIFVRESTDIRAPQVYAMYTNFTTGNNYIIMERIRGESLQSQWPLLQETEKQSIIKDLQSYFMDLRKLTPPNPSYYGSLDRRPLQDMVFCTAEPGAKVKGPFDSHEQFTEAMVEKYTRDGGPIFRAEYYRQCLPKILCQCDSTFTHGDFQRKNVMIEKDQEGSRWTVTLLDWEFAGWYPSYWEYSMAFCALGKWDDDWCLYLRRVLEAADCEAAWVKPIRLEMFE
ncbi:hypothetical protein KC332_g6414 [Hortaea werneckii]|uniref:Aminoglycoside phosphotransferase domain-containing protein n=2 Tax=Hortaea werneckii TaxID=91943 RepID=A0A3M7GPD5_HORWE|nr:hypothetical protein KC358_g16567 [Hortaea werneckii]OTA34361.1 hypothetical protein BTJ68_07109 [Hortaea werneckii EXF-2000]KAI6845085.1 hypothetical protein KC350_g4632 [Hortaea werneckii]KAI6901133.1 hypothetical protein KC348_g16571 [Hortaea werneckii]KAI6920756.1 hypothetical protein KC341_g16387 [Hortaea werneckii]